MNNEPNHGRNHTKQLTALAMLTAVAYIATIFVQIRFMPAAPFLVYDPKDVVIVIAGFIFGPLATVMMAFVLSFIEMVTVSGSGPIGMLMNFLSSAMLAVPAAYMYRKHRNVQGAILGLAIGIAAATLTMILWNYIIMPAYTGLPREVVVSMIVPIIIPFNLIKNTLNASLVIILYKPVSLALKKARLHGAGEITGKSAADAIEAEKNTASSAFPRINIGLMLFAVFMIVSLVLVILIMQGVL